MDLRTTITLHCGGPGSGRHKGTGMTDQEFTRFAERIGNQLNFRRPEENVHRAAGRNDEANAIYNANKEQVKHTLANANVKPKDFDDHMKKLSSSVGRRVNVKMSRLFPD
jgi:hypothetical protein